MATKTKTKRTTMVVSRDTVLVLDGSGEPLRVESSDYAYGDAAIEAAAQELGHMLESTYEWTKVVGQPGRMQTRVWFNEGCDCQGCVARNGGAR